MAKKTYWKLNDGKIQRNFSGREQFVAAVVVVVVVVDVVAVVAVAISAFVLSLTRR